MRGRAQQNAALCARAPSMRRAAARGERPKKPPRGKRGGKRGMAMVEAALVFPLVIASVMAVVYLMINLYSFTALRSSLHVTLRAEADAETGLTETVIADGRVYDRYRLAAERRGIRPEHHRKGLINPYVAAEESKSYKGNAMIRDGVTRTHYGRFYVLDEVSVVRNLALVTAATGKGD
jgi:hypothetical protein